MPRNVYQVGEPGSEADFNSVQAAIDQAVLDGHTDVDDPAVVELLPGVYTEDVALPRALTLRGFSQRGYIQQTVDAVRLLGTVTVDLTLDGTVERTVARMTGIEIAPSSGPGIVFTGSDPSILNLDTVTVNAEDDVAIRADNTGAGSRVQSSDSVFRASAGNPGPAVETSVAQFLTLSGFIEKEDPADVAVHSLGGDFVFVFGRMFGALDIDAGQANFLNAFQETAAGVPVADVAAGATFLASNSTWLGATGDLVTGAGLLLLGPMASVSPLVFDPALSVVSLEALFAPAVRYNPGTPGDWLGAPPSTSQEALDRIASAVVGLLGGAIP